MLSRFQVWPLVDLDDGEKSIPDWWLSYVWDQMHSEGRDIQVFYTGVIKTEDDWLKFIKNVHNFPVFVMDAKTKKPVMAAWLNNVGQGVAEGHFCSIGRYQRGSGEIALNYWRSFKTETGEQFLKVIYGVTPETYTKVFKLLHILGFERVGTIPGLCFLAYEQKRTGGVISYLSLEGIDNGRREKCTRSRSEPV